MAELAAESTDIRVIEMPYRNGAHVVNHEYSQVETEGRPFILTINRPEVMNAISLAASHQDVIDATRARELVLVAEVVLEGEALVAAKKLAGRILRCAPLAIRATKQCVLGGLNHAGVPAAQQAQEEGAFPALQAMMLSEDVREGLNAFLEKRRPEGKGR